LSDVFAYCDAVAWRIFIKLYNSKVPLHGMTIPEYG
jgi:hypothetical protein